MEDNAILVVNINDNKVYNKIIEILETRGIKYFIKSQNKSEENIDIVFELNCKYPELLYEDLCKIKELTSFNLLNQDGECQF